MNVDMHLKYDDEYIIALLIRAIRGCDMTDLIYHGRGQTYGDIAETINHFYRLGYLEPLDNGYILTPNGKEYLDALNIKLGRRGIYRYIVPEFRQQIQSIKPDDTYLP